MIRRVRGVRLSTWLVLLLVLALLLAGVRYSLSQQGWGQERSVAQAEVTKLERARSQQKEQIRQARAQKAREVLGASPNRLSEDEQTITSLTRTIFTWDSAKSYDGARSTLKKRYGLSEEGSFLTGFMPPARFTEDAEGERYTYIDTVGVSSRPGGDPKVHLRHVSGTEYSYVVLLETKIGSKGVKVNRGQAPTVSRPVVLEVTVDGAGEISDLSARMSTTGERSSG